METTCVVTAQASPSQNGRKTRHGSLGGGTLIIRDCSGSMMGNKLSVISHQRTPASQDKLGHSSLTTPESSCHLAFPQLQRGKSAT